MPEVTHKHVDKYFSITEEALNLAQKNVNQERKIHAMDALDMVQRYLSDAKHFQKKGDLVTAFAAINYAHGWLDCGARTGLWKVKDSRLFTVD